MTPALRFISIILPDHRPVLRVRLQGLQIGFDSVGDIAGKPEFRNPNAESMTECPNVRMKSFDHLVF
jgi:hypothetical protein